MSDGPAPVIHQAWLDSFSSVNKDSFPHSLPSDRGYILPDPNSFIDLEKQTIREPQLYAYLQLRPYLIQRLGIAPSMIPIAVPLPGRIWRQILLLDQSSFDEALSTSNPTKAAADRHCAASFLGACIEATKESTSTTLGTIKVSTPIFRGSPVSREDLCDVAKQILRENAEIQFCIELGAMNEAIGQAPSADTPIPSILDCVCSKSAPRALLVIDPQEGYCGLASTDPHERLPQLIQLHNLFRSWSTYKNSHFPCGSPPTSSRDILTLEAQLYRFYTFQFFAHFGRYPVVPRSLA